MSIIKLTHGRGRDTEVSIDVFFFPKKKNLGGLNGFDASKIIDFCSIITIKYIQPQLLLWFIKKRNSIYSSFLFFSLLNFSPQFPAWEIEALIVGVWTFFLICFEGIKKSILMTLYRCWCFTGESKVLRLYFGKI